MNRRCFLKKSALSMGALFASNLEKSFAVTNNVKKPNVILINVDDQGYGDLSCHGNPILKTPCLDKFYKESVRFTDFHVNPYCAPTRAALMTGKLSDRVHVHRTLNMRNYLPKNEKTIADIFKDNDYLTALFGKWHLGHNYPYRPIDRGFDEHFGVGDGGLAATSDYWGNDRFNDHYDHNGKWEKAEGFNTDVIVDRSMKWIKKHNNQPFFMYLAPNVPHGPWNVKEEWLKSYKDKELPNELDIYYASIERVDYNLGRFFEFLKKQNIYDDTIIIFITDNGTSHFGNTYNAGMRQFKISVYEGGHRVPCFFRGPSKLFGQPRDIDTLTGHIDILPTLVDICNLKLPSDIEFDGKSLVPLFKSSNPKWPDRSWVLHSQNFTDWPEKWKSSVVINKEWKTSVVLTQQWRLIDGEELYDIQKDPGQKNNVAADHPDVVKRLRQIYEQHWKDCKLEKPQPYERPIVGTKHQTTTELGPDSWVLDPPTKLLWWQGRVRLGKKVNGYWPVEFAKKSRYRFDVRRWPEYINAPINGIPKDKPKEPNVVEMKAWVLPECVPLEIDSVRLNVNETQLIKPVKKDSTAVSFELDMDPGPADIRATFLDEKGDEITGGYYVYVSKK